MSERHRARGVLATLTDEQIDAEREAWIKSKSSWEKREIDAAEAGWDYVLDMSCDRSFDMEEFDGGSEAGDMADGCDGWKKKERGACADYIYEGMQAARLLLLTGSTERKKVSQAERDALLAEIKKGKEI